MALNLLSASGLIATDTLNYSGDVSLGAKDSGNQIMDTSSLDLGNSNYQLAAGAHLASITPISVTLTASREYSGDTSLALAQLNVIGALGADTPNVGGTVSLAGASVGKQIISIGSLNLDDNNYQLSASGHLATITPREITLAAQREYDGTVNLTLDSLTANNVISGDTVTLSGSTALVSANAGQQSLNVMGLTLDSGNYRLASSGNIATIDARVIQLAAEREYNGSTELSLALISYGALVAGDTLNLSGTVSLIKKDVGEQRINVAGLDLGNGNYTVADDGNVATIVAKPIQLTAGREYDGSIDLSLGLISHSTLVASDRLSLSGSASVGNSDAGEQLINVIDIDLGNDNYVVADNGNVATIKTKKIQLSAEREYDGGTDLSLALLNIVGLVADDQLNLSGSTSLAAKNTGSQAINIDSLNLGNSNYSLGGNNLATINQKLIIVQATAEDKLFDSTTTATISLSEAGGLLIDDQVELSYASAEFSDVLGVDLQVEVQGVDLIGDDAGNYILNSNSLLASGSITRVDNIDGITQALISQPSQNLSSKPVRVDSIATNKTLATEPEVAAASSIATVNAPAAATADDQACSANAAESTMQQGALVWASSVGVSVLGPGVSKGAGSCT